MRRDAHGWWLRDVGPVDPMPSLHGNGNADFVVIGGGFTGLWTAWLLREAEPNASVVLIEAEVCGEGPSGRNGGFVNATWFSLPSMRQRFGDEGAIGVARAAQAAADAVGEWCAVEAVDAHFTRGGYLEVSTTPSHDATWEPIVDACRTLGEPDAVRALSPDELAERCASPVFRGAAFYPGTATVHPARLTRGLRAKLIEAGVQVYENTKVTGIAAGSDAVEVGTAAGSVSAGHVVLASGGAVGAVQPLRRRLTLTSSHMVITEPIPELIDEIGWTGGECITDCRHMVNYTRTTRDGRIALGWGGGRVVCGTRLHGRSEVDAGLSAEVAVHLRRFFPAVKVSQIEHAWGGPIDVSPSHTPIVGSLGERVHYGFGYTGNGVGPSRMVAGSLTSLALGRDDEAARLAIVEPQPLTVPPEPFRYIGGVIIRRALLRRERAEEAGRKPGLITRAVAAVPELIGVQVGR